MRRLLNLFLCVVSVTTTVAVGSISLAHSNSISPFSDFLSSTLEDYQYYQFKITYLDIQTKPVPSLGFHDTLHTTWDITKFKPYQNNEFSYINDLKIMWKFHVKPREMKWFVQEVGKNSSLTDISFIPEPYASFMILRDPGTPNEKAFESLLSQYELTRLLYLLHESLDWSNTKGIEYVGKYRRMHWP